PEGAVLEINRAGLEMLEVGSVGEIGDLTRFVDPQDRPSFLALHARVIAGESGSLAFRITGGRGARRWLETNATPLRDERGNVVAMLGVTRDVTERRLAEHAIREQAEIFQA